MSFWISAGPGGWLFSALPSFTLSKILACFTVAKLLKSSTFRVTAVWAATADELEIGIDPAVFSSSGKRSLSRLFSRRNRATSCCCTWKTSDSSTQNWKGVGFWSSRYSIPRDPGARATAAAAEPLRPEFLLPVGMSQTSFLAASAGKNASGKGCGSITHADGSSFVHQVTQVLGTGSVGLVDFLCPEILANLI